MPRATRNVLTAILVMGAVAYVGYLVPLLEECWIDGDQDHTRPVVIHVLLDATSQRDVTALLGIKAAILSLDGHRLEVHDIRGLGSSRAERHAPLRRLRLISNQCVDGNERDLVIGPFTTTDTRALLRAMAADEAVRAALDPGGVGCNRIASLFLLGNVTMNAPLEKDPTARELFRRAFRFAAPSNDEQAAALIRSLPEGASVLLLRDRRWNNEYVCDLDKSIRRVCTDHGIRFDAREYQDTDRRELEEQAGRHDAVVLVSAGLGGSTLTANLVTDVFHETNVYLTDTWSAADLQRALPSDQLLNLHQTALPGSHASAASDPEQRRLGGRAMDRWSLALNRRIGARRTRFLLGFNLGRTAEMLRRNSSPTRPLHGMTQSCGEVVFGVAPTDSSSLRPRLWDSVECPDEPLEFDVFPLGATRD